MIKMLALGAALSVATMVALPQANAAGPQPEGYRNSDQIEVSSQRRFHRRYYGYRPYYGYRRYWGPRYAAPYYGPYYRPYYARPWPLPFVGPFWY